MREKQIFTKADCGEQIDSGHFREAQLRMLDELSSFCDAHGLRYYLSGGTLLGAIRHKGFIPWDDDIDINMPRPDLEKLMAITGGRIGEYTLHGNGNDPYSPGMQWTRFYNEEILVESFYGGASDRPFYEPLFLDIFPIEGFPDSEGESKSFSRKLKLVRSLLGVSSHWGIMGRSKGRFLSHVLMYIPAHIVGTKNWIRIFQKLARKYDFEGSEYIGVTTVVHYLPRERVRRDEYLPIIKVDFEGRKYNAPAGYDTYLRQLYRDYMTLPPEEKRVTEHKFNMYRRKAR